MNNFATDFIDKAKGLTRNPLGIIALFVSLIYGFACLVLSTSLNNLHGREERLPLIWFIILFPCLILIVFTFLVVKHHKNLYAPSDFKDEKNFVDTFIGHSSVTKDLEKVNLEIKSLVSEEGSELLVEKINRISSEIEKIKEKSEIIPINSSWILNHWGSDVASIVDGKIIFKGTRTRLETDGCHVNLKGILKVGSVYKVSCFVKARPNTTGKFQLWCHDSIGVDPPGSEAAILYVTPSMEGEPCSLRFEAKFNSNLRIHLQYEPGEGQIEVSDIRITELQI